MRQPLASRYPRTIRNESAIIRAAFRSLLAVMGAITLLSASLSVLACAEFEYEIWIPRSPSADPLYRFTKGKKMGFIDASGKIQIPPVLSYEGGNGDDEFHDGLLEIGGGDGVYVNTTGKKVIRGLERGWDFSEGLAVAMPKGGDKWGFIDKTGKFVIAPRFATSELDYPWSFEDGLAMIMVKGKIGYIDHSGAFMIPPSFLEGNDFHEGFARVVVEGPCAYVDEDNYCPDFRTLPRGEKSEGRPPSCKYGSGSV